MSPAQAAPRPGYHFTLPAGHLNDPLGVTWHEDGDGGRYDLFYQLNPEQPVWAAACRWGQADGADLVRWRRPRTALEPAAGEGCWSGAVVVDQDGSPVIVYTRVDVGAPDLGRIALARGRRDWSGWTADPGGPAVAPPGAPDLHSFRDPFVWAVPGGWRMLVGGGARDGRALALQYSSPDLRTWRLDGVLAGRDAAATDPLPTGTAWECPQLFPLDGSWVLLVSAWDGAPQRVVAAVGDYDGERFTARAWQPFDAAAQLYATSAFRDAAGRWCALSWLPGAGTPGAAWAGMLSVPALLSLDGDRLRAAPHPDVASLRGPVVAGYSGPVAPGHPVRARLADPLGDVELAADVPGGGRLVLAVREEDGGELLRVELTGRRPPRLRQPGRPDVVLPAGDGALRLLLDVGVAELFTAGGALAAVRLPGEGGPVLVEAAADGDGARLDRLVVRSLERWFAAGSSDSRRP